MQGTTSGSISVFTESGKLRITCSEIGCGQIDNAAG
jgi:hypothetical protein